MIQSIKLRVSARGVPHTVIRIDDTDYSIQWFHSKRVFAVFSNYGTEENKRVLTIDTEDGFTVDVVDEIEKLLQSGKEYKHI
jgi:hypothetical protein